MSNVCVNCGKQIKMGRFCGERACRLRGQREYMRTRRNNDPEFRRRIRDANREWGRKKSGCRVEVRKCRNCGKVIARSLENLKLAYCSQECRTEGYRQSMKEAYRRYYVKNKKEPDTFCINCGKQIQSGDAKFCSQPACKRRYIREYIHNRYHSDPEFRRKFIASCTKYNKEHKIGWKTHIVNCRVCKKDFMQKFKKQQLCSPECKKKARNKTAYNYYKKKVED